VLASDFVPSDTSTNVDSDPLYVIDALSYAPIRSSFMVHEKASDVQGAFFEVPAKHKDQKSILFGRIESEPITFESSRDSSESPQFFHYGPKSHHIMKRMGYDLTKRSGLNFGKEKRALLRSFIPKGNAPDYYHKTQRGLGYVSAPVS